MFFHDRQTAAHALASSLQRFRPVHPLILAPVGNGTAIATPVAEELGSDADLFLFAEIFSPGAIPTCLAVVNEFGDLQVHNFPKTIPISSSYLQDRARLELANLKEQRNRCTPELSPIDPLHRTVILVDDGIVTGATMCGAISALKLRHPESIVVAVPVANEEGLRKVQQEANEVIALNVPASFQTLSEHYDDLQNLGQEQISRILIHSRLRRRAA